jgi:hypothetical protein
VRYVDVGRQLSDFDGDGYADLVLTAWGGASRGRVLVGFGPLPSSRGTVLENAVPPETADGFGQVARPLGDVDADGFADLLVTAPSDVRTMLPGNAYVFFGSATFAETASKLSLLEAFGEGELPSGVGVAVPVGDVDADGMQDFVIDSTSSPKLFRGNRRGVSATDISVLREGEYLAGVSSGDVTGDGHSDLFAICILGGTYQARYELLRGSSTGLGDATVLGGDEDYPVASWTIPGDVNGDGFSDLGLAVDDPANMELSHTDVSLGAEMPSVDPVITWAGGIAEPFAYVDVGGSVTAGDVNGDGFEDSLVPLGWHLSDLVQANLYLGGLGSRSEPDAIYLFQTGTILFISASLPSGAGDVNGDGFDDVFLVEDFGHTGKLYLGGPELDSVPDDELALALE